MEDGIWERAIFERISHISGNRKGVIRYKPGSKT